MAAAVVAVAALGALVSIKSLPETLDSPQTNGGGDAPHRMRRVFRPPADFTPLAETLRSIHHQTDPVVREGLLQAVIGDTSIGRIPEMLRRLQDIGPDETAVELSERLARKWAEADPQAAAGWAARMPDGPARAGVLDQVAIAWANRTPDAAASWARSLPEEEMHASLGSIARETVRADPVKALQFSCELPAGEMRDRVILHATAEWVAADAGAAIAWVRDLSDETLREQALSAVATAWGDIDPSAAAALAATELPPGRAQDDAVVGIVQRWAQTDPERAAAWVGSFPEDDLRRTALENLTRNRHFPQGR